MFFEDIKQLQLKNLIKPQSTMYCRVWLDCNNQVYMLGFKPV